MEVTELYVILQRSLAAVVAALKQYSAEKGLQFFYEIIHNRHIYGSGKSSYGQNSYEKQLQEMPLPPARIHFLMKC